MRVCVTFIARHAVTLNNRIRRRLTTQASRFRFAVSTGFIIAAAGVLVVGADTRFSRADGLFSFLGFLGRGGEVSPVYHKAEVEPGVQDDTPFRIRAGLRGSNAVRGVRFRVERKPVPPARLSMCVRLCDGFAFPVGDYRGAGDRAAHEATCQSECPGAATALFVMPRGSDSIADARQVGSGRSYSAVSDAFHYTTYLDETCSCHPAGGNRIKSLLRDFTLRRGDAVMTAEGMRVFHGGVRYPYTRKDFVALAKSQDLRKGDRASLRAIERASLVLPTTVVAASAPTMASNVRLGGTKSLQHEARN
jgi:hypothetical protein